MTDQEFIKTIDKLGGPLAVARQIVAIANQGSEENFRVIISRKINGHTKIEPEWKAFVWLLDYIKQR